MIKKFWMIILFVISSLFLSSCGGAKVDELEIKNYLSESYGIRDMSIEELRDIVQEPGETQNKRIITCTVVASNKYAMQTANWTLEFEQFDGEWVGTSGTMGHSEYQLTNEISEEDFAQVAFSEYVPAGLFDILDLKTDFEAETATAHILCYSFYETFYGCSEGTATVRWNPSNMCWEWFRQNVELSNYTITLSTDLSVHFERQDKDLYEVFDIVRESEATNNFCLKNYYCNYNNYYELFTPYREYKYELDDIVLDFQSYSYGSELRVAIPAVDSIRSKEANIVFYISGQTLYYVSPHNTTEKVAIKTDLPLGNYDEFTNLWPGTWQGAF